MDNNVKIFLGVVGVVVLGVIVTAIVRSGGSAAPNESGRYDSFASCLGEKGAVFYGAFWCPHCAKQKKMFGSSVKLLPYIECSTLDGNSQTEVCKDKKIESYPTWEFADGSRLNGEIPLDKLAEKTACVLPE